MISGRRRMSAPYERVQPEKRVHWRIAGTQERAPTMLRSAMTCHWEGACWIADAPNTGVLEGLSTGAGAVAAGGWAHVVAGPEGGEAGHALRTMWCALPAGA